MEDVHDAADLVLRPDRQMNGDTARRELVLDLRQRAVEVGALAVEHVHEQDARQPELVGEVLDARSAHLEPHDRVDDDQRSLHDAERAAGLALKARITRNVDEVDLAALPARVSERQRDRHLPLLLVLVPVGDRGAGVDRTQSIDLVGLIQQRLDEGRLARPAMADDGDVADLSGLDWGHGRPFLLVMSGSSESKGIEVQRCKPDTLQPGVVSADRASMRLRMAGLARRSNPQAGVPRLVQRFAAGMAIAFLVVVVAVVVYVRHSATEHAKKAAESHAEFVALTILRDVLVPEDFTKPVSTERRRELDRLIDQKVLVGGAVRVKLYGRDGTVIYATDHSEIGTRELGPELVNALGGIAQTEVGALNGEGGIGTRREGPGVLRPGAVLRRRGGGGRVRGLPAVRAGRGGGA